MVSILDGQAIITIGGEPHPMVAGEAIVMPAHIPHAVKADGRFKMMLTMIRETPKV
jgi:quercetin dioxygenase-like cupin family protein